MAATSLGLNVLSMWYRSDAVISFDNEIKGIVRVGYADIIQFIFPIFLIPYFIVNQMIWNWAPNHKDYTNYSLFKLHWNKTRPYCNVKWKYVLTKLVEVILLLYKLVLGPFDHSGYELPLGVSGSLRGFRCDMSWYFPLFVVLSGSYISHKYFWLSGIVTRDTNTLRNWYFY